MRSRLLLALLMLTVATPATAARNRFSQQARVGFTTGDQWEPAITTDRFGRVYVLYPQYGGFPGCPSCPSPTMALVISPDGGTTWSAPRMIADPGTYQVDAQIVTDPADRQTLYAAWLQNNKSDIDVAKSTDSGQTWTVVTADSTNAGTDKPILVVRGQDVYVGYDHTQTVWVSSSHDGGQTFTSTKVSPGNTSFGWSLAGGGALDAAGNVYFAWAGYTQNGGAKGPVNLYISKSSDRGATWSTTLLDVSGAPPDCSAYSCGWAYLGAQMTMASDSNGALYALWNAGSSAKSNERIYFSRSTDGGSTWSPKQDVSLAGVNVEHAFPAIAAGAGGDVRIAWMDTRNAPLWNVYYRSSTNGGNTWGAEAQVSGFVTGFDYIQAGGFDFPFGDYFQLTIDSVGLSNACWGEGLNYQTPGSIWFSKGK